MKQPSALNRRLLFGGLCALAALGPATVLAKAATPKPAAVAKPAGAPQATVLRAEDFGVVPNSLDDQSAQMQAALDAAHDQGRPLLLPAGHVHVRNLDFPAEVRVSGIPNQTVLIATATDAPVGKGEIANNLWLEGITFAGLPADTSHDAGLFALSDSAGVSFSKCQFLLSGSSGLLLQNVQAAIEDCTFDELDIAIFSHNSRGLMVRGNRITKCGNGGILIWRDAPGPDGSIVTGNAISGVEARAGGDGQNGNGVNLYMADNVIVSDNVVDDCAFSAIRANSTRNAQIRGNTCTSAHEVAIYSEFAFSGSIIASNVIDGAAAGISVTNLDKGGHLATVSGNIVRNITFPSPSAPGSTPYGVYAEADTVVTGNTIDTVPGFGILAGNGPYLRNVLIADNVISSVKTGVGVSVADGAGTVRIAGNLISGAAEHGLAGMQWDKVASGDLAADAGKFANVTAEGNVVGP